MVRVFQVSKDVFGLALAPVGVHHRFGRPTVSVGNENPASKDSFAQVFVSLPVDPPIEIPVPLLSGSSTQLITDHTPHDRRLDESADLFFDEFFSSAAFGSRKTLLNLCHPHHHRMKLLSESAKLSGA